MTVAEVIAQQAALAPGAVLLESARDPRRVTRAELAAAAQVWTRRLDDAGVPRGGRVGLQGRDPLLLATAILGVLAAGRCVAPIGPDADVEALTRWRRTCQPWATVPVDVQALDGSGPELVASPGDTGVAGVVLASSGTTGAPKLVALTENHLLATAGNVAQAHELTPADRCLNPLPLWHINAEVVALLGALVSGGTVVLEERFRRTSFWQVVAERGITWINAVPAILAILAREPADPPPAGRVRFARSASAPLPPSVQTAFEQTTGVPVVQTYGMTEAASQITAEVLPHHRGPDYRPGSVGRPFGVELRVTEPDADGTGRIQIRGPGVITAYASPAGADRITPDGWVDTGDLGHFSADGDVFLDGRRDDIINRGGEKLSPLHLEDILLDVPGTAQLVIVGAPDTVLGQVPVGVAVATADAAPGLAHRLAVAAEQRLDRARRPVRFHVLPALPSGVNGKVSRRAVLAMLVDGGLES